ncbi:MAG: glycerol kinase GlpK [Coxiellaceae bacterium]|nr:glycerol kinase GlpK [Coxiellaceae bacterium]
MPHYFLAIDQGTTSTRAMIFDERANALGSHQIPFKQHFPDNGWVEHMPTDIWETTLTCCKNVLLKTQLTAEKITAIGITNQRETTIVWDKKTGEAIYPAIVWQDRRTAKHCAQLSQDNKIVDAISNKTGLRIDAYFSATKIAWILDHVENTGIKARDRAEKGELAFGTIDTFLLWKFTNGKSFATDATNASRTLLFNIHTQTWDDELLAIFNIPKNILPTVLDCNAHFGVTEKSLLGAEIPITGIAGDQQAASIGQACFNEGMIKSTYGTGCFVMINTGKTVVKSHYQLLSTIAYRINHKTTYALEGSIFSAGVGMQWLTQNLKCLENANESEKLIADIPDTHGVYFVPAFTGLGAPYWNPDARAAILGITRETQIPHIVRAALEAVAYQTCDLIEAIKEDISLPLQALRVDGGMTHNAWLLQFLADMLAMPVMRNSCVETSALGVALLAGLGAGVYKNLSDIEQIVQSEKIISPKMHESDRKKYYDGWKKAVTRVL